MQEQKYARAENLIQQPEIHKIPCRKTAVEKFLLHLLQNPHNSESMIRYKYASLIGEGRRVKTRRLYVTRFVNRP